MAACGSVTRVLSMRSAQHRSMPDGSARGSCRAGCRDGRISTLSRAQLRLRLRLLVPPAVEDRLRDPTTLGEVATLSMASDRFTGRLRGHDHSPLTRQRRFKLTHYRGFFLLDVRSPVVHASMLVARLSRSAVQAYDRYLDELWDNLHYWATWQPTAPIALGDVGEIGRDYIFVKRGTLAEFGIPFDVAPDADSGDLEHVSRRGVSIAVKAEGEVSTLFPHVPDLRAAIRFSFSEEHSVVFRATECYEDSLKDQLSISQAIVRKASAGDWPLTYAVITHVVRAARGTIIISGSRDASIELSGSGEGQAGGHLDIAASAGVQIGVRKDIATQVVASEGLTPLFRPMRVRKSLLSGFHVYGDGFAAWESPTKAVSRVRTERGLEEFSPSSLRDE